MEEMGSKLPANTYRIQTARLKVYGLNYLGLFRESIFCHPRPANKGGGAFNARMIVTISKSEKSEGRSIFSMRLLTSGFFRINFDTLSNLSKSKCEKVMSHVRIRHQYNGHDSPSHAKKKTTNKKAKLKTTTHM
ncbi:hypothetical protein YC2023_008030 [Brassica napus]